MRRLATPLSAQAFAARLNSFLHRGDLEFVPRAGEAVQQQDDRRLRHAVREIQRADDLLAVDREIHRLLGGEQGRRRKAGCRRGRQNQMLDHCDAPCFALPTPMLRRPNVRRAGRVVNGGTRRDV